MNNMNLKDVLKFCQGLALQADKIIMNVYTDDDIGVDLKDDFSPVTQADILANELIVSSLLAQDPFAAVLSEESADDKRRLANDWCFIVDPLDGTKGFIAKSGEFTVNIALAHKGQVVVGVVSVPVTGEVYYAAKGAGAFYEKDEFKQKLVVSDRVISPRMVRSKNHPDPKEDVIIQRHNITDVVYSGSSIKGCLVAHGKAEIYYRFGETSEWDTAAMQCIVECAGGIFRQGDGDVP